MEEEIKQVGKCAFRKSNQLGRGNFGVVFRGELLKNEEIIEVAIKQIPFRSDVSSENYERIKLLVEREINVMRELSHENILKFHDAYLTENNVYLVTEFCNGGDLNTIKNDLTIDESLIVVKQIAKAMAYANKKKIIHRDLKPANILIKDGLIKVADFGLARTMEDIQFTSNLTQRIGSPLYMAPETFNSTNYGMKCDVWSLGVTLYELISRDHLGMGMMLMIYSLT